MYINELLPSPCTVDWNLDRIVDSNDQWIELYNTADAAVNRGGWKLSSDASAALAYIIPPYTWIQPHEHLVFSRSQTHLQMGSSSDSVRLVHPDNKLCDAYTYPNTACDRSWGRIPDGGASWSDAYGPSPSGPNLPRTATPVGPLPRVSLNEVLPAPRYIDWDQDGTANSDDEWIVDAKKTGLPFSICIPRVANFGCRFSCGRQHSCKRHPLIVAGSSNAILEADWSK